MISRFTQFASSGVVTAAGPTVQIPMRPSGGPLYCAAAGLPFIRFWLETDQDLDFLIQTQFPEDAAATWTTILTYRAPGGIITTHYNLPPPAGYGPYQIAAYLLRFTVTRVAADANWTFMATVSDQ